MSPPKGTGGQNRTHLASGLTFIWEASAGISRPAEDPMLIVEDQKRKPSFTANAVSFNVTPELLKSL
jgi:hypothetical protein